MDANFFRMLVLKAKTIKIEGAVRSIFRLIILKRRDKLFTAAGITGHRIYGRGMIRRDEPSAHQWMQYGDRTTGVASRIRDARSGSDFIALARRPLWKTKNPVRIGPVCDRGIDDAGGRSVDEGNSFPGCIIRQT